MEPSSKRINSFPEGDDAIASKVRDRLLEIHGLPLIPRLEALLGKPLSQKAIEQLETLMVVCAGSGFQAAQSAIDLGMRLGSHGAAAGASELLQ